MQFPVVSAIIHYAKVYYGYAGKKLLLLCGIIFMGGISEGFGISMMLPILDFEGGGHGGNIYSQAIYRFVESLGWKVSLVSLLALLFVAFLLKGLLTLGQGILGSFITIGLNREMKIGFYDKYSAMRYDLYANSNIGFFNNVITTEIDSAVGSLSSYIEIIVSLITITIYVSGAFIINHSMTLTVLVLCCFLFLMLRVLIRISRELSIRITASNAVIQSLLIQTLYFFKYLKATDRFRPLKERIVKEITRNLGFRFKARVLSVIPKSMVEPLSVLLLSLVILFYVGYRGQKLGELLIPLVFFYKAFTRVFSFQTCWQKFNAKIGGIEVVEKTKANLDKNKDITGTVDIEGFKDTIRLENVSFTYAEKQVLCNVNIKIPKNKCIGIVGKSGAGKTTIFDLLVGLISPQTGDVTIDGVAYDSLNLKSIRRIMGYVTQEPVIFNDTIANNICFWECDYNVETCRQKIKSASRLANCDSFIEETENGYETIIGDKGIKLSGGQRQRISIARELFKEPEIMIFDEATSSLDSEAEKLIQDSINSMVGERTIVIIAHRLSTIKVCDYIYVLNEGRVIEEGAYEELYRDKNSNFGRMCAAQNM